MKRSFILLILLLAHSVSAPALAAASPAVGVTLPPLAGLVQLLLPHAAPVCLLRASGDPHHSQLTPRQVAQLRHFTLLLRSSGDDGGWSGLNRHGKGVIDLWPQAHHAWLVPTDVQAILPRLMQELSLQGSEKAVAHQQLVIIKQLHQLDHRWQALLLPLKQRGVIMQHPAWQRLFLHYGVPVRAVLEQGGHGHEGSPRTLERALQLLHGANPPLLIAEQSHANRMIDWLHQRVPASQQVALDALGRCGQSLIALIADNQQRLARVLLTAAEAK
ncbi:MAG: zinc ABC transporter substrate-binding protein [Mariprofundales bacterium]